MKLIRITTTSAMLLACSLLIGVILQPTKADERLQERDAQKPLQGAVASKTAKFATVSKTDPLYTNALDAHDLAGAKKLVGQSGSFKGIVSKLFEERDGDLVVLDFDPNYRTALTAVLKNSDFPKFPDIHLLDGKEIVVSGKFVDFHFWELTMAQRL